VVVGEKGLDRGVVEYRGRSDEAAVDVPLDGIGAFLSERI
jgi:hypothetical protein